MHVRTLRAWTMCAISCFVASSGVVRRAEAQARWSAGIEGGVLRTTLSRPSGGTPDVRLTPRASALGGGYISRRLTPTFSLESGFGLTSRGVRWTIPDGRSGGAMVELRSLSLDVPLMLHATVAHRRRARVDVSVGGVVSRPGAENVHERATNAIVGRVPLRDASLLGVLGAQVTWERRFPVRFALRSQHGVTDATDERGSKHRGMVAAIGVGIFSW